MVSPQFSKSTSASCNLDLQIEIDSFMPLPRGPLVLIFIKNRFINFQNIAFTGFATDGRTAGKHYAFGQFMPGCVVGI